MIVGRRRVGLGTMECRLLVTGLPVSRSGLVTEIERVSLLRGLPKFLRRRKVDIRLCQISSRSLQVGVALQSFSAHKFDIGWLEDTKHVRAGGLGLGCTNLISIRMTSNMFPIHFLNPPFLSYSSVIPLHSRPETVASNAGEITTAWEGVAIDVSVKQNCRQELRQLLELLPEHLRDNLQRHECIDQLVEIVLDLGRRPMARFPLGDWIISESLVCFSDLEHAVSLVGDFADDNRAGIDRTLHRVSAIRNRAGRIVGLTCRVGRAIYGSAQMVRGLVTSGDSLLLMGPPGVGKTTAIRDIARLLADEYNKRVVIVDTSNEIAGDGDIPHPGIGRARRMQVHKVDLQHEIMIEAVENHMPQTIVIDEIGTELEAMAAGTIAQRGVQLIGTAHGMTVDNLIKNPSLQMLAGGIQSVTLGDEEARRRGVQKSVLERKGPPTFRVAVEMTSRTEWRVHRSLAATVDNLLVGRSPVVENRKMCDNGQFVVVNEDASRVRSMLPYATDTFTDTADTETDDEDEDFGEGDISDASNKPHKLWEQSDTPVLLYTYQVTDAYLEQVIEVMGLQKAVHLTNDIGGADAVLTLRSKLKQNSWVRGMAKLRQLPVFAIKANTMAQMVRAMRAILGMESLIPNPLTNSSTSRSDTSKAENYGSKWQTVNRKTTLEDEIDALEEARLAIEQIVIPKGQPVELLCRNPDILALQRKLVEGYQLVSEVTGSDLNARLRILPTQLEHSYQSHPSYYSDSEDAEDFSEVSSSSQEGGTSVSRLPILPD